MLIAVFFLAITSQAYSQKNAIIEDLKKQVDAQKEKMKGDLNKLEVMEEGLCRSLMIHYEEKVSKDTLKKDDAVEKFKKKLNEPDKKKENTDSLCKYLEKFYEAQAKNNTPAPKTPESINYAELQLVESLLISVYFDSASGRHLDSSYNAKGKKIPTRVNITKVRIRVDAGKIRNIRVEVNADANAWYFESDVEIDISDIRNQKVWREVDGQANRYILLKNIIEPIEITSITEDVSLDVRNYELTPMKNKTTITGKEAP